MEWKKICFNFNLPWCRKVALYQVHHTQIVCRITTNILVLPRVGQSLCVFSYFWAFVKQLLKFFRHFKLVTDPVFGTSSVMSPSVPPTYSDVMKAYLLRKHELKSVSDIKEPLFTAVTNSVISQIGNLWQKSSIPIISHQKVMENWNYIATSIIVCWDPTKADSTMPNTKERLKTFVPTPCRSCLT